MKLHHHLPRHHRRDKGYILLLLLVLVTLAIIAMAAIVPQITAEIRRGREDELIHRGKQYERAIQLYFRKFGRFPASLDELSNTNNIRFLRKRYVDPMTGKDEWRVIHLGQAKPKKRPAYLGAGLATGQQPQNIGTNVSAISKPLSGSTSSSNIGGGPIVGVASTSTKESIKELDEKDHYNEWEFTYDPTLDRNARGVPGQPPGLVGDRPTRGPRDSSILPPGPLGGNGPK